DDNPVNPPVEDEHPYADRIVDNGVIFSGPITEDRSLVADSVYYLDGYVFVEGESTLDIEPGTVIKAFSQPSEVSEGNETSLIITRNATINAEGTPDAPIIFTSELDDEPLGGEITLNQTNSKLWAGLIVLGNAPVYSEGNTDAIQIEGIPDGEERAQYGGTEENHSSGILKYVSIRFSGAEIGPGDEIQGLTLGGVGAGTTLEYIDIFVSADDGIEIFGGTVNIKHISVAFSEDDSFDLDLGWTGTGQYLFALQGGNGGDHVGEWDGGKPDNAPRYSTARMYNMTLLGHGYDYSGRSDDSPAMIMRDGSAYSIYNSIIAEANGKGIEIEDRGEAEDSYDKTVNNVNGDGAAVTGNMWYTANASSIADMIVVTDSENVRDADGSTIADWLTTDYSNVFDDPQFPGVCRTVGCGTLDPMPGNSAFATFAEDIRSSDAQVVDQTDYIGAFAPGEPLWISGWTTLARYGYMAE
ncbi:MAG: hypothetical protein ACOC2C_02435, partial [Cyclonatronaceae bacterium]